jgi:hypothetical protein
MLNNFFSHSMHRRHLTIPMFTTLQRDVIDISSNSSLLSIGNLPSGMNLGLRRQASLNHPKSLNTILLDVFILP